MQSSSARSACVLLAIAALCFVLPTGVAGASEIIVDDQDGSPTFTTTGDDWTTWGMNGYGYDGGDTEYHYLSHTVGGSDRVGTATWTPDIDTAGTWRIDTWFRRTENRTDDADHYIYDGLGGVDHVVIDQTGDGESGWVELGEYYCDEGSGGCIVVLDGTDDNNSDEANAVRFTLVSAGEKEEEEAEPCEGSGGTATGYGTWSRAAGWENEGRAEGEADGSEASSENVDAGEYLQVGGWELCEPSGAARISAVTLGVRARTQYDSGTYEVELLLDGGGSASTVFNGTSAAWHSVDLTGDQAEWTWDGLADVVGQVTLHDHPGGARDSDAWVDAFRLEVTWAAVKEEVPEEEEEPPADTGTDDTDPPDEPDSGGGDGGGGDDVGGGPFADDAEWESSQQPVEAPSGCGCTVGGSTGALLLLVPLLATLRRRR